VLSRPRNRALGVQDENGLLLSLKSPSRPGRLHGKRTAPVRPLLGSHKLFCRLTQVPRETWRTLPTPLPLRLRKRPRPGSLPTPTATLMLPYPVPAPTVVLRTNPAPSRHGLLDWLRPRPGKDPCSRPLPEMLSTAAAGPDWDQRCEASGPVAPFYKEELPSGR
jgi:hypothetical protein